MPLLASVAVVSTVLPDPPVTRSVPVLVSVPPPSVPADQVEPMPATETPPVRAIVPPLHSRLPPMARLPAPESVPFDIVMSPVTVMADAPFTVLLLLKSSPPSEMALLAVSVPPLFTAKVAVLFAMPLMVVAKPPWSTTTRPVPVAEKPAPSVRAAVCPNCSAAPAATFQVPL